MRTLLVAVALLAPGLTFTAPAGWKQTQPGSSMRVAEFTLPRAAGDAEDAQLVVYYFIKLTGPAKTIASWDRAYDQFVSSLRFQ